MARRTSDPIIDAAHRALSDRWPPPESAEEHAAVVRDVLADLGLTFTAPGDSIEVFMDAN